MGAANKDLLAAIAGMFVLLPGVVGEFLMKASPEGAKDIPFSAAFEHMMQSYADNWPVVLGHGLITSFGSLAMLVLLLRPERLTVAESLKAALVLLPGYFVANLVEGLGLGIGLSLFVVPGLYLLARFALIGPVAAAEQCRNPIEMIRRSFVLSQGNGWRIFLMLAVLFCTAGLVALVLTTVIGLLGALFLPNDLAELCLSIGAGLVSAGLAVFVALLSAAIYHATTEPAPSPWLPGSNG
jgi:hypothetical protein